MQKLVNVTGWVEPFLTGVYGRTVWWRRCGWRCDLVGIIEVSADYPAQIRLLTRFGRRAKPAV
jgi:hypothetical protein